MVWGWPAPDIRLVSCVSCTRDVGPRDCCASFRGILLLPCHAKVLRKAMRPAIANHYERTALSFQSGERRGMATGFASHCPQLCAEPAPSYSHGVTEWKQVPWLTPFRSTPWSWLLAPSRRPLCWRCGVLVHVRPRSRLLGGTREPLPAASLFFARHTLPASCLLWRPTGILAPSKLLMAASVRKSISELARPGEPSERGAANCTGTR